MNRMRTRDAILAVVIAAGFIVHAIGTDWSALGAGGHVLFAVLGLAIALGAVGALIYDHTVAHPIDAERSTAVREPAVARFLFHDTRSAPIWLAVRLYVGIAWLTAGWEKIIGSPSWLSSGAGLQRYWQNAASIPKTGKAAISYDWYRDFIRYMLDHQWHDGFAKAICVGEVLIGVGLIVGGLTGIAHRPSSHDSPSSPFRSRSQSHSCLERSDPVTFVQQIVRFVPGKSGFDQATLAQCKRACNRRPAD